MKDMSPRAFGITDSPTPAPLKELKRYGPQFDSDNPQVFNGMGQESLGDWVKYADVVSARSPHPPTSEESK